MKNKCLQNILSMNVNVILKNCITKNLFLKKILDAILDHSCFLAIHYYKKSLKTLGDVERLEVQVMTGSHAHSLSCHTLNYNHKA